MNKRRKKRKFSHHKITRAQIESLERQYWEKYNSGMPQWQAAQYQ